MATEKNTKIPEEVRKRMYEAYENYYDKSDNRMEAVNDNDLDGISGGVFNEDIHNWEDEWEIEDGLWVIQYTGTDMCSSCGITQLGTRFFEFSNDERTIAFVLCQTCAMAKGLPIF